MNIENRQVWVALHADDDQVVFGGGPLDLFDDIPVAVRDLRTDSLVDAGFFQNVPHDASSIPCSGSQACRLRE